MSLNSRNSQLMLVRALVQLFHSLLDLRQHAMYHPRVKIPRALEDALKKIDAVRGRGVQANVVLPCVSLDVLRNAVAVLHAHREERPRK